MGQVEVLTDEEVNESKDYEEQPLDRVIAYIIFKATTTGNQEGISARQIKKLLGLNYDLRATMDRLSVLYPLYKIKHNYFMEEFHATHKKRAKNTGESKSRVRQGEGGRNLLSNDKLGKAWSSLEAKALAADAEAARFIKALKSFSADPYRF